MWPFRASRPLGETIKKLRVGPWVARVLHLDSSGELKLQFLRKVGRTQGISLRGY